MTTQKTFKWLMVLTALAGVIGSAAAFFLWSLDVVTKNRFDHPWLIWFLPLVGCAMGFHDRHHGKSVRSGNTLILDHFKNDSGNISSRLAPSILVSTLVTHAFGGSAGREGTAVQMGAGIGASFARFLASTREAQRLLVHCGIAAGFGAVFGTPARQPNPDSLSFCGIGRPSDLPCLGNPSHALPDASVSTCPLFIYLERHGSGCRACSCRQTFYFYRTSSPKPTSEVVSS
jgi:hypothetical protein